MRQCKTSLLIADANDPVCRQGEEEAPLFVNPALQRHQHRLGPSYKSLEGPSGKTRGVRERHGRERHRFPRADRFITANSREKSAVAGLHLFAGSLFVHRGGIIPTRIEMLLRFSHGASPPPGEAPDTAASRFTRRPTRVRQSGSLRDSSMGAS